MDFKDQIKQIGERITATKDSITTEEATKMSMIAPVIQALGYNVFDHREVVPEFTCDVGIKKGEKIDYALMGDNGIPIMLWECKHWQKKLDTHEGQLYRYFAVSKTRFSVLTNGIVYRFYSDLDKPNVMDEKPFFEFDITKIDDVQCEELKKFSKPYFSIDSILATASEMKHVKEIKRFLLEQSREPQDWFVREIVRRILPNITVTAKIVEQFTPLIKKSFAQVINESVTDRLKTALSTEEQIAAAPGAAEPSAEVATDDDENRIVTTQEELEGFYAVRAVLRGVVDLKRIIYRDTASYFGVLLDDNNRKPVCRLHFNREKKYIETFDDTKKGTRHEITGIDDIFDHAATMIASIELYDGKRKGSVASSEEVSPSADTTP